MNAIKKITASFLCFLTFAGVVSFNAATVQAKPESKKAQYIVLDSKSNATGKKGSPEITQQDIEQVKGNDSPKAPAFTGAPPTPSLAKMSIAAVQPAAAPLNAGQNAEPVENSNLRNAPVEQAATGWFYENNAWHYSNNNGIRQTGWLQDGSDWYYLDNNGKMQTGWVDYNGGRYYLENSGQMQTGWVLDDNGWFYLSADRGGAMLTSDTFVEGQMSSFDNNGVWQGYINGKWHYSDDGTFFFGDDGQPAKGWLWSANNWYYFNPASGQMQTGWILEGNTWYHLGIDGKMTTGWLDYGENLYHLASGGQMSTGWEYSEDNWHYFNSNGTMLTGWHLEGNTWYHLGSDGKMTTGWLDYGENQYHLANGGQMNTGWALLDNTWYHFDGNGAMNTGWYNDNGTWYYLENNGQMKTGWLNRGENRYYLANGGQMQTGWVHDGSNWYFFNPNGDAAKGWAHDGNTYYYFNEIDGSWEPSKNVVNNGVDVSSHQGVIDWAKVSASGMIDFAIIRALSWDKGNNCYVMDPYFETNVRNAKKFGIEVGTYFYSYAFNTQQMIYEIDFIHNSSQMNNLRNDGISFDLPFFLDFEWNNVLDKTTYQSRTDMVLNGLVRIDNLGYTPGFYSNLNWANNYYNARYLEALGYDFWLANYKKPNTPDRTPDEYNGWHCDPMLWQYTSCGQVPGINGNVDMNFRYYR